MVLLFLLLTTAKCRDTFGSSTYRPRKWSGATFIGDVPLRKIAGEDLCLAGVPLIVRMPPSPGRSFTAD